MDDGTTPFATVLKCFSLLFDIISSVPRLVYPPHPSVVQRQTATICSSSVLGIASVSTRLLLSPPSQFLKKKVIHQRLSHWFFQSTLCPVARPEVTSCKQRPRPRLHHRALSDSRHFFAIATLGFWTESY
jgi:hypothetical protein